jgi:hypothetical protein
MKKKLRFPQKFVFLTPSEYRSLSHEGRLRYMAAIARQLQRIRAVAKASAKKAAEPSDGYRDEVRPPKNKRAHP